MDVSLANDQQTLKSKSSIEVVLDGVFKFLNTVKSLKTVSLSYLGLKTMCGKMFLFKKRTRTFSKWGSLSVFYSNI